MSWSKEDGARIKIDFDRPLIGDVSGNEGAFTVTVPEYTYVPDGTLQNVSKTVASVSGYTGYSKIIVLEMASSSRFESAAGDIVVAYSGGGTLQGEGGAVAAFSVSFTPVGLVPKPDQNDSERVEIADIAATGNLVRIAFVNSHGDEHMEISEITAVGVLTNINDL